MCPYNPQSCWASKSADEPDQAQYQSSEGKVLTVREHATMSLGTTYSFSQSNNCTWHLAGSS